MDGEISGNAVHDVATTTTNNSTENHLLDPGLEPCISCYPSKRATIAKSGFKYHFLPWHYYPWCAFVSFIRI